MIIDEAAQATEGETVIPFLLKPKRVIAVGDPMQLPATLISQEAVQYGFHRSLHERLMFGIGYDYGLLDVQYRMKPCISKFPSHHFYQSRVKDGHNVLAKSYRGNFSVLRGIPFCFINVSGFEKQNEVTFSFYNEKEAKVIVKLLKMVQRNCNDEDMWYSSEKIRIITFYQGQVNCIRQLLRKNGLPNILVSTVDSSQGCEAEIIILSFTRANNQGIRGFVVDPNRLNVSLTRAKYQLICVGDGTRTLAETSRSKSNEKKCPLVELIRSAQERNVLHSEKILSF